MTLGSIFKRAEKNFGYDTFFKGKKKKRGRSLARKRVARLEDKFYQGYEEFIENNKRLEEI